MSTADERRISEDNVAASKDCPADQDVNDGFGDQQQNEQVAPMAEEDVKETSTTASAAGDGSGDRAEVASSAQEQAEEPFSESESTVTADRRSRRAVVGIDSTSRLAVFQRAERVQPSDDDSSITVEVKRAAAACASMKKAAEAGDAFLSASDTSIKAGGSKCDMKVKEYFSNFDAGDAVGMMSPYLTACAQLLDIEYLVSSLMDMKVLSKTDPILRGLAAYIDNIMGVINDVGMEPELRFLAKLKSQQDLDDHFAHAQEAVVMDAMTTAGKLYAAAISARRRREALSEIARGRSRGEDAAPAGTKMAADSGDPDEAGDSAEASPPPPPPTKTPDSTPTSTGEEPCRDRLDLETLCTAAEYYTKLFRKVSAQENDKDLELLVGLIDKISRLTNEINRCQPGVVSNLVPDKVVSEIAPQVAETMQKAKARAEKVRPEKSKCKRLSDKDILGVVAGVLPELVAGDKLYKLNSCAISENEAVTAVSHKLLEAYTLKVPERERYSSEAARFTAKHCDERAAVQALALFSDELNDFLSRLVIDGDVDDEQCEYEAEAEDDYGEGETSSGDAEDGGSSDNEDEDDEDDDGRTVDEPREMTEPSKMEVDEDEEAAETAEKNENVGGDGKEDGDLETGRMPL